METKISDIITLLKYCKDIKTKDENIKISRGKYKLNIKNILLIWMK